MPRGSRISAENKQLVINNFTELYEDTTEEFVNLIGGNGGTVLSWVSLVRGFRPKQFQVDFYVNKLVVPNSLIQLFLDVSPAMVSIVGTERDVYRVTMRATRYATLGVNPELNAHIAKNMAYVVARLGQISYANNNLPNWRKPSDMSDSVWEVLKYNIESGVREGENALNLADRLNANAPEVAEVVEDDAFVDMDGEVAVGEVSLTPEMTDTPEIGLTPMEELSDDRRAMVGRQLANLPIVENTTITPNWAFNNRNSINFAWGDDSGLSPSEGELVNTLRWALALENGYISKETSFKFLKFIKSRGFSISPNAGALDMFGRSTGRTQNNGAFLTIQIKANSSNARRFNRATWNDVILRSFNAPVARTRLREFWDSGEGANLRTTRFSGRGSNLRGVLAIPYNGASPSRDSVPSFSNAMTMYQGLVGASSPTSAPTDTTQQQTPPSAYFFLGVASARSGSLYNNITLASRSLSHLGANDGSSSVYVFWFGQVDVSAVGGFQLYQLQWGNGIGMGNYGINDLSELQNYFIAQGSRLGTPNTLQLFKISNGSRIATALLSQDAYPQISPYFSSGTADATLDLLTDNLYYPTRAFKALMEASRNVVTAGGADPLASGSTAQDMQQNESVASSLKAIKTQLIDRTFAYEVEGNFRGSSGVSNKVASLRKSIKEVCEERGVTKTRGIENEAISKPLGNRFTINESGNGLFTLTLKGDMSVQGSGIASGEGFETDSPVFIPKNIDIAKTNIDDSITAEKLAQYTWSSYVEMWEWISIVGEAMLRSGVRIHKSAGLHIHISNTDFTNAETKQYLENFAGFEPLFDLMMPVNSRKAGRSYNASIVQEGTITTGHSRGSRTPSPSPTEWRRTCRTGRSKVRTETGIGTLEFRHTMTSIDSELTKHFIILAYSLVEASKIKQFTSFKFKDLESFLPIATSTYLYNRIEDLAQPDVENSFFEGERGVDPELQRRNLR